MVGLGVTGGLGGRRPGSPLPGSPGRPGGVGRRVDVVGVLGDGGIGPGGSR